MQYHTLQMENNSALIVGTGIYRGDPKASRAQDRIVGQIKSIIKADNTYIVRATESDTFIPASDVIFAYPIIPSPIKYVASRQRFYKPGSEGVVSIDFADDNIRIYRCTGTDIIIPMSEVQWYELESNPKYRV